jgi:metal-sulfur cluster biosynthetic enzyme
MVAAELATEAEVAALVRSVADEVYDPCGMAQGLRIGLAEMGLVREVAADPGVDGWEVRLRLRLTSPGCQYFFYFQQELEARLLGHPGVAKVSVNWDGGMEWTPEDLAASARSKIQARQHLLRPVPR